MDSDFKLAPMASSGRKPFCFHGYHNELQHVQEEVPVRCHC